LKPFKGAEGLVHLIAKFAELHRSRK